MLGHELLSYFHIPVCLLFLSSVCHGSRREPGAKEAAAGGRDDGGAGWFRARWPGTGQTIKTSAGVVMHCKT